MIPENRHYQRATRCSLSNTVRQVLSVSINARSKIVSTAQSPIFHLLDTSSLLSCLLHGSIESMCPSHSGRTRDAQVVNQFGTKTIYTRPAQGAPTPNINRRGDASTPGHQYASHGYTLLERF